MRVWKEGERCQVSWQGRSEPGVVRVASPNGVSLLVEVEALVEGHVGEVPLLWQEGRFRLLFADVTVTLGDLPATAGTVDRQSEEG